MAWEQMWKGTKRGFHLLLRQRGLDRYNLLKRVARKENNIIYLFGLVFTYLSVALAVPFLVALYYNEDPRPWLYPTLLSALLGVPMLVRYRSSELTRPTEAMFVVTTAWLVVMAFGAIPYVMYGMGIVDALFESMSGFTTTGSSIMLSIESWPRSLLFWRSFTQWLGGAGIVMIFVTIFPILGVAGRNLMKNEFPGLDAQNISLRIQEEARKFHYIYAALSAAQVALLLLTGIGLFDSVTVMFSTISTGGFSIHTQSIGFYANPLVEWTVIIFMFLAGTNYYLHYQVAVARRLRLYWRSVEFRAYLVVVLAATTISVFLLWGHAFSAVEEGFRTSMFQVVSVLTSTGFATVDFAVWNKAVLFLLFALIIIGGCTGSTSGGIKVARFLISREFISTCLYKTVHPRAIFSVKWEGRTLGADAVSSLMAVIICYFVTALAAAVALILMGIDPITSMSAAITTLSNCGPGIGVLGPMGTFGGLPDLAKIVLTFTMWVGRLEFLTVFVVLTPVFWRELLRYGGKERNVSRH